MTEKSYISVAPMMDWTDRHCRYFHRLISPNAYLYTEMITTGALIHGDAERFLAFDPSEHPVALQIGGSNPGAMATCAKLGEEFGYDEININCGCPSDRVQSGRFGACLMGEPETVAECVSAMKAVVSTPITVKCRIGIDEQDSYEFLHNFIETVSKAGCETFIIHARKAWLTGLSPKENREIPPPNYDRVKQIKQAFPKLKFVLNGGLKTLEDVKMAISTFDGAMIGREAYQHPYFLAEIEREIFQTNSIKSPRDIALSMIPYIENQQARRDTPPKSVTRHMTGLFQGQPGARHWRRSLSENAHAGMNTKDLIQNALPQ